MIRLLIFTLIFIHSLDIFSQNIPAMTAQPGKAVNLSAEGEKAYCEKQAACQKLWSQAEWENRLDSLEECDAYEGSYYDVLGPGCSWYCGGGLDTATASSHLAPAKTHDYAPQNAHDLNYATAWVEGVAGNGIGEYLVYHFPPQSPRITDMIIVNGLAKTENAWRNNNRVKKIKLYINDIPTAVLSLADTRDEQIFHFEPIGYGQRDDYDELMTRPWWTLKFEILEIYPGEKYDDTAITEIYFDGIDVHCFARETQVLLSNGKTKNISDIVMGDEVMTYVSGQLIPSLVVGVQSAFHPEMMEYVFTDRTLVLTADHPLMDIHGVWKCWSPKKAKAQLDTASPIHPLATGDDFLVPQEEKMISLQKINNIKFSDTSYSILTANGQPFIANGMVAFQERLNAQWERDQFTLIPVAVSPLGVE
jgi:hypothetical protein